MKRVDGLVTRVFRLLCLWLISAVSPMNAAPPGTVVAWGDDRYGHLIIPEGLKATPTVLSGVTAIAAGDYSTLALKSDGTVVEWIGSYDDSPPTPVPALSGVTAIAAAYWHAVALKSDGSVVAWGADFEGETGVPAGLSGVTAIATGWTHTVALKSDGTVVAWGGVSQFPDFYINYGHAIVPPGLNGVTAIAAGLGHTVVLRSDGTVFAWGDNTSGQTSVPFGLSGVTAIAAGNTHTVALKADGAVMAWGDNTSGQTTIPVGLNGVTAIAAGGAHTVALKSDGTVVAWGANNFGQTTVPPGLSEVTAIAAGWGHTVALGRSTLIATQPSGQTVVAGQNTRFAVTATGAAPLRYQWRKDGVDVKGATTASLELGNVQPGQVGHYHAVITNAYGSVASSLAALTMNPEPRIPPGKLTNLSVRTIAGGDAPTLVVGFVVAGADGAGTLPVLVRGTGPALAGFGVTGVLADPILALYQGSTLLSSNDNWGSGPQVSSAGTAVGAFPLMPGSLDAALYHSGLAAGSYAAQVTGNGATRGMALAEIYDAAPGSAPGTMRLINVSARGQVDTSGSTFLTGFVIFGSAPRQVLIRAMGPALSQFGVTGVLADPLLNLYNSSGELIARNDNWNGDALLTAAFMKVGAFAPLNTSKDAALVVTLPPGDYTAEIFGTNNTGGVALMEVYEVPY